MILRKPYAFLIKHFRLIHLIISLLLVYILTKTYNILSFFKDYINKDIAKVIASDYINFLLFLAIILFIGLIITMIVLMKKKKKPVKIYILTVVVYTAIFIGFIYLGSTIEVLETKIVESKTILMARDITRFMFFGQLILLFPYIIRTLGFDIKKFDFKKDLQELNIETEDNEEFELTVGIDKNKVEQVSRRRLRELKYYYIENKLFINIILIIFVVFIGYFIVTNIDININPRYDEKEVFKMDNFYTMMIEDSYLLNSSPDESLNIKDKMFLVVKFNIKSSYNKQFKLDTNKFKLKIKDVEYIPNRTYYNYFTTYGVGYKGQKISLNDNKEYILIYLIDKKYKDKKMKLEYHYRYDNDGDMLKKIVKLEPEVVE